MTLLVTFESGVLRYAADPMNQKRFEHITDDSDSSEENRAWLSAHGIADRVTRVAATGATLSYILEAFPNLPRRYAPRDPWVVWFGDTAKFIAANL